MTPHAKKIPNEAVHPQESLRVRRGFEPPHLSLALAGRLMRDFGSIVFVLLRAVNNRGDHEAVGRRVTAARQLGGARAVDRSPAGAERSLSGKG